jgi:hypothetical protein
MFLNLYIDESGSRHPDKKSDQTRKGRDWFALGGFLIAEEDELNLKQRHSNFIERWSIRSPLHMTDMLSCKKSFSWLGRSTAAERDRFWSEYTSFLSGLPVLGTGCVIDRPGYVARGYLKKHGNDKWLLCRSAFDILVERSAKLAKLQNRRLRVVFEGDVGINDTIKGYFKNLKTNGLAFDPGTSQKYKPLAREELAILLYDIEYKDKKNVLVQVADTFVYSIARQRYEKRFNIFCHLRDNRRIINFALDNEHIPEMGIKYYCFD